MAPSPGAAPVFWLMRQAADVPEGDSWLSPRERERQAEMRFERRREDWRLGRWAAKAGIGLVMPAGSGRVEPLDPGEIEIRAAADGAPEAFVAGEPVRVGLSLGHRSGRAVCAASDETLALGCDLELVEPRPPAFVEDFYTPEEQAEIDAAGGTPLVVTAMWSAKESALKSLRTGLRSDTRDVRVRLWPDAREGGWGRLCVEHRSTGRTLSGWWHHDAPFIVTLVADRDILRPVRLEGR